MLFISALGPLHWRPDDTSPPRTLPTKLAELLALLVVDTLNHRVTTRSRVAGLLFPDNDEAKARRLLNNILYRLKQTLSAANPHVVADADTVKLVDTVIDAVRLDRALAEGDFEVIESIILVNPGDLLADLDFDWIMPERTRLRAALMQALPKLVERELAQGRDDKAQQFLLHWRKQDATDEHACDMLMRLYWRGGRVPQALVVYADYRQALQQDLGLPPSAELTALADAIRADNDAATPPAKPRFVGRRAERAHLLRWLGIEHAASSIMLIEGEPGIGKTTLAQELLDTAEWRGMMVAYGGAAALGANVLAPLSAALAQIMHAAARKALIEAIGNSAAAAVFALIDGSGTQLSQDVRLDLGMLIRRALDVAADKQQLLMVLDDVQWADPSLWETLPVLLDNRGSARLFIVLLARSAELRNNPAAWQSLVAIDANHRLERVTLGGFEPTELAELAQTFGQNQDPATVSKLHALSNGNPLLARELVLRGTLTPARLDELFAARLRTLSNEAQQALAYAALIGRRIAFDLWQAACPPNLRAIPVNELLRSQLLLQSGNDYALQHDLLLTHLSQLDLLSPQAQHAGHARVAVAMERAQAAPAIIAHQHELATEWRQAFAFYEQAADRAIQIAALASARQWIDDAERVASCMEAEAGAKAHLRTRLLRLKLAQAQNWSGEQASEAEAIASAAIQHDDIDTLIHVRRGQIRYLGIQGKFDEMNRLGTQAMALADQAGDAVAAIQVAADLVRLRVQYQVDFERDQLLLQDLLHRSDDIKHPTLAATVLLTQATLYHKLERFAEAEACLQQIEQLHNKHPDLLLNEMNYLALKAHITYAYRGDIEKAREIHLQRLQRAQPINDFNTMRGALHSLTLVGRVLGQLEEAVHYSDMLLSESIARATPGDDPMVHFARSVCCECNTEACAFERADEVIAPSVAWLDAAPRGGLAAFNTLVALTGLRYQQKRYVEAAETAQRILDFLIKQGSLSYVPMLLFADAAWHVGMHAAAQENFDKAQLQVDQSRPIDELVYFYWVQYQLTGDPVALARARATNFAIALKLRSPQFRRDALTRRSSNRDIALAWAKLPQPTRQRVLLAKSDATLHAEANISVEWTLHDRLLDDIIERTEGQNVARLERLKRLSLEANMAGAAATHQQLAEALGVSLRTVDRDVEKLAAQGVALHTRKFFLDRAMRA